MGSIVLALGTLSQGLCGFTSVLLCFGTLDGFAVIDPSANIAKALQAGCAHLQLV